MVHTHDHAHHDHDHDHPHSPADYDAIVQHHLQRRPPSLAIRRGQLLSTGPLVRVGVFGAVTGLVRLPDIIMHALTGLPHIASTGLAPVLGAAASTGPWLNPVIRRVDTAAMPALAPLVQRCYRVWSSGWAGPLRHLARTVRADVAWLRFVLQAGPGRFLSGFASTVALFAVAGLVVNLPPWPLIVGLAGLRGALKWGFPLIDQRYDLHDRVEHGLVERLSAAKAGVVRRAKALRTRTARTVNTRVRPALHALGAALHPWRWVGLSALAITSIALAASLTTPLVGMGAVVAGAAAYRAAGWQRAASPLQAARARMSAHRQRLAARRVALAARWSAKRHAWSNTGSTTVPVDQHHEVPAPASARELLASFAHPATEWTHLSLRQTWALTTRLAGPIPARGEASRRLWLTLAAEVKKWARGELPDQISLLPEPGCAERIAARLAALHFHRATHGYSGPPVDLSMFGPHTQAGMQAWLRHTDTVQIPTDQQQYADRLLQQVGLDPQLDARTCHRLTALVREHAVPDRAGEWKLPAWVYQRIAHAGQYKAEVHARPHPTPTEPHLAQALHHRQHPSTSAVSPWVATEWAGKHLNTSSPPSWHRHRVGAPKHPNAAHTQPAGLRADRDRAASFRVGAG